MPKSTLKDAKISYGKGLSFYTLPNSYERSVKQMLEFFLIIF